MIVCLGDSLTYGYGVPHYDCWVSISKNFSNTKIINKGLNGDTTSGMLFRIYETAILLNPSHIFVMGGTNDFLLNRPVDKVFSNMKCIIKDIFKHKIIPIVGIQIPVHKDMAEKYWEASIDYDEVNNKIQIYRDLLLNYCTINNIKFFDFFKLYKNSRILNDLLYTDGIHPSKEGHKIMSKIVNF
ncbi:GDSL-type esterase/lipase family protein [Clostridium rectalis]|uniref:GDSL-type esterase/lipase family protein n=1 Tax=Clostridium rectalis TaxID=2040295 RepID=UPI0013DDE2F0|nr:GDSL-type esterase/lipase family protein [Clostridium rectalis]